MIHFKFNIIDASFSLKDAMSRMNSISGKLVLFVLDDYSKLLGTITDGDIRRALLADNELGKKVSEIMNTDFHFLVDGELNSEKIRDLREKRIFLLPVLDSTGHLLNIIDIEEHFQMLPITAIIMAGGEGKRLRPLTKNTPKPMLPVCGKPILHHNIERLSKFGISNIHISVKYLAEIIKNYFDNCKYSDLKISYIDETKPLGTIGSISKLNIEEIKTNTVLVMNSDILTNIDFDEFYEDFIQSNCDMSIACVSYDVNIPYAVVEIEKMNIKALNEKPTYNYLTNGGIYLFKKEIMNLIPKEIFYNATDLIHSLIEEGYNVRSYKLLSYWLDIGKMEDYKKAQEDFKHIKF
jgi:dTDP-glucose pyrophosphorylase